MKKPRTAKREYYVYIMISETPTKFGKVLRRIGKITYNHVSIAFDSQLRQLYSFGRRKNGNPLSAGLVREHIDRFTLLRETYVSVKIYKLCVSREQYLTGKKRIRQIMLDADGYLYNLFSVLSFPILHGFDTYKAYTCAEFVANVLHDMGIELADSKPFCRFTPEEIGTAAGAAVIFEGNLLDYCTYRPKNASDFFEDIGYRQIAKTTCTVPARLIYRMIRRRKEAAGLSAR